MKEKEFAINWLENWRTQWETQDIDNYIKNYSDEFSSPPFNKRTWFSHKQKLKEKYKYVKLKLSDPNIFQLKKQYIFQFVQNYESSDHSDVGVKTLYVLKQGDTMKITREEWSSLEVTAKGN